MIFWKRPMDIRNWFNRPWIFITHKAIFLLNQLKTLRNSWMKMNFYFWWPTTPLLSSWNHPLLIKTPLLLFFKTSKIPNKIPRTTSTLGNTPHKLCNFVPKLFMILVYLMFLKFWPPTYLVDKKYTVIPWSIWIWHQHVRFNFLLIFNPI